MPPKIDRKYEALRKAAEALMIDWETCIILTSKYDPTRDVTVPGTYELGNSYAIKEQVREWLKYQDQLDDMDCDCPRCSGSDGPSIAVDPDSLDSIDGPGFEVDEDDESDDIGNR